MRARIGRLAGSWYVNYREDGPWGRNHYAPLFTCLRCWWRVKRGREPLEHMRPYGEHL